MQEKPSLLDTIQKLEGYCRKNKLNHRFVGGVSFGGLLNSNTSYTIDIEQKTVSLIHHNETTIFRKDKSIRDIDIILFCEDKQKINLLKQFVLKLERQALKNREPFPLISLEATIYPSFGRRDPTSQLVTALEVDKRGKLYLAFDDVRQEISWVSVEPWSVILENGDKHTVRNPIADYYAYFYRSPGGLKPKDARKIIFLKKLVDTMVNEATSHAPSFNYYSADYYGPWKDFINSIVKSPSIRVQTKIFLMRVYWQTIGTTLSHGKGLTGKVLAPFFNQFTGIKQ